MNNGVLLWLIIFALSAACFFIIALVVSVKGIKDLRDLLRHSEPSDRQRDFSVQEKEEFSE